MLRVLNVISNLNNAGTEAVVMNYYRNIDREKIQFDFLVLNTCEAYYESEILSMGGKIFKIPSFMTHPMQCIKERNKFFKTHRYDIVEVHSPSVLRYAYCKMAKKMWGAKVIFHIHNNNKQTGLLVNYARRQIKNYCDEIVSCSQVAAESVLRRQADQIVYNAIDYDKYKFDEKKREQIRSYYNIQPEDRVIGFVGRFSLVKNPIFLLQAFAKASNSDHSLILIMKGFGELKDKIINEIRRLNIEDRALVAGDEFTAAELYNAFDLFAMPSLYEGLPVVSIETQANGLRAVLSSNISRETNISGFIKFIDLNLDEWCREFLTAANYERLSDQFDFCSTRYEIKAAAAKRQSEYLEMVYGKEEKSLCD